MKNYLTNNSCVQVLNRSFSFKLITVSRMESNCTGSQKNVAFVDDIATVKIKFS